LIDEIPCVAENRATGRERVQLLPHHSVTPSIAECENCVSKNHAQLLDRAASVLEQGSHKKQLRVVRWNSLTMRKKIYRCALEELSGYRPTPYRPPPPDELPPPPPTPQPPPDG